MRREQSPPRDQGKESLLQVQSLWIHDPEAIEETVDAIDPNPCILFLDLGRRHLHDSYCHCVPLSLRKESLQNRRVGRDAYV
jgi:hypothetical protein